MKVTLHRLDKVTMKVDTNGGFFFAKALTLLLPPPRTGAWFARQKLQEGDMDNLSRRGMVPLMHLRFCLFVEKRISKLINFFTFCTM